MGLRSVGDDTEVSAAGGRVRVVDPKAVTYLQNPMDRLKPPLIVPEAPHEPLRPHFESGVDIAFDASRDIGEVELCDADGKTIALVVGVASLRIGSKG